MQASSAWARRSARRATSSDGHIPLGVRAATRPRVGSPKRVAAVPKAAYAAGSDRPTPQQHLETMGVQGVLGLNPTEILVVDDVVTKGAMLLACVSLLQDAFPNATVRGF